MTTCVNRYIIVPIYQLLRSLRVTKYGVLALINGASNIIRINPSIIIGLYSIDAIATINGSKICIPFSPAYARYLLHNNKIIKTPTKYPIYTLGTNKAFLHCSKQIRTTDFTFLMIITFSP